jgi:UDP-N-acetylglucosamine acyltransferase
VTIYPFATIGAPSQDRKAGEERAYTTIGDRTIIREYTSVNRATGEEETTSIGDDCLLLAYVHIAHNCRIGNGVTMSNLAQIAGHVTIEDHATIGGMAGIHQFVRVGRYSMVAGMTRLVSNVLPYFLAEGNPAQIRGLNRIGLRRAQFTPEALSEIKECYKTIYRSGLNLSQALEALREKIETEAGREIVAFLETESDRGVLK